MCRANRVTRVNAPIGVFWVVDTLKDKIKWRINFVELEMYIDDFNDTVEVAELLIHTFAR